MVSEKAKHNFFNQDCTAMSEHSPWRLRQTTTRVYYIWRIDDEMASGEIVHCSEEDARALIAKRHRDWHTRRHPDPLKRFLYFQCFERRGHRIPLADFWDLDSARPSRNTSGRSGPS